MRIKLKFYSEGPLVIPVQYNHAVQSLIYNNISEELAEFLHEWGFVLNGQRFKLFTFSRLEGRFRIRGFLPCKCVHAQFPKRIDTAEL
jgi:CRISPR-associated endoribonuclease Cas6